MTTDAQPPAIDPDVAAALKGRSLLKTLDFDDRELETLLGIATSFEQLDRQGRRTDLCPNELAYALFFDQSTRTKSAWAGAAARLGMQAVIVDGSSTQVSHGETAVETGTMLGMNSHAMGIRHDLILHEGNAFMQEIKRGIDEYLAATRDPRRVPIVNLQCDIDHPTQTLADLSWLLDKLGSLAGKKVAVSWAYSPSYAKPLSVPQGLIMLLPRFGAHVKLAHPAGYALLESTLEAAREGAERSGGSFEVVDSMDAAFDGAQVVYPKSWGPRDLMEERIGVRDADLMADIERRALERNSGHRDWICNEARMGKTQDALYLHCLPADIGAEVTAGVMEKFRTDLAREAQKKVYVIMALVAAAKVDNLPERLRALNGEGSR